MPQNRTDISIPRAQPNTPAPNVVSQVQALPDFLSQLISGAQTPNLQGGQDQRQVAGNPLESLLGQGGSPLENVMNTPASLVIGVFQRIKALKEIGDTQTIPIQNSLRMDAIELQDQLLGVNAELPSALFLKDKGKHVEGFRLQRRLQLKKKPADKKTKRIIDRIIDKGVDSVTDVELDFVLDQVL